ADFSGYSDMAIGMARLFGIELVPNFHAPYAAQSLRDFWQRWHMSLMAWFRDYIYVPLGGRRSTMASARAAIVVFLVSGLWHGANWTFVAWGAFHGAAFVVERALVRRGWVPREPSHGLAAGLRAFVTFQIVCAGWLLFRASSLTQAARLAG